MKLAFLLFSLCLIIFISCSSPEIRLDIVRESSNLITCYKVYGTSLKKIEEENDILVQTGQIDTTTEQPPINVAVIKVNNNEIILTLVNETKTNNRIIEEYSGHNYNLILDCTKDNAVNYTGSCTISTTQLKSTYHIVGTINHRL